MTKKAFFSLAGAALGSLAFVHFLYGGEPADARAAKSILIQHEGRVKSFEAFSRQTIEAVTTQENWDHQTPVTTILSALYRSDSIAGMRWIRINYRALILSLRLPVERHFFSYDEIVPSLDDIESLVRQSQSKRDQDLRPSKLEEAAESLYAKLRAVKQLMDGRAIKVIPADHEEETWLSPYRTEGPPADQFKNLVKAYGEGNERDFNSLTDDWKQRVGRMTNFRHKRMVAWEVFYFDTRPFHWAWVAYLSAFVIFTFLKRFKTAGIALLTAALLAHTAGLALRILILSRPPVSNMYESMIWMNWVLMITAALFSLFKKNLTPASIGSLISAVIMIYGDLLPIDTHLDVLVPVLRSNYWLTIHVMTIVSSYGVFGLAMGLGHRHLILDTRKKLSKKEEERSAHTIYRALQIGTLLIGIGTVLGGVWANESWGRFWGWDPKETWALITFLGYAIVIHLKFAKILKPFGMALSAVLGFLLVLMTWYGVNFVLGRGLHNYGQGSGGLMWIIYYLILEGVFLGWVLLKRGRPLPR